jgi:hypothetical protein
MATFIHKSLVNQIKDRTLLLLESNGKKKLIFNEKVSAGFRYHAIGVNDFGHVFMSTEISISWDLISGQNLIKILNQIKNNEFVLK